jgi:hypothetical protein
MKFKIIGRKFGNVKEDPSDIYSHYPETESKEFLIEASNIADATKWMLLNYPDYYMGCSILSEDNSCFSYVPVPDFYEEVFGDLDRKELISIVVEHDLKQL